MENDERETGKFEPKINPTSEKILQKKKQRALDQAMQTQSWVRPQTAVNQNSYTPKINTKSKNMTRVGKIELILDSDAKRRQQKKAQALKSSKDLQEQPRSQKIQKTSEEYIYKRLERDLEQMIEHLGVDTTRDLNYDQCYTVLIKMGFIVDNSPKDQEQFHQLWEQMQQLKFLNKEESVDA